MERESLLSMLIIMLGGVALQIFAAWPLANVSAAAARQLERASWLRLWWPLTPTLIVAAWLCGWALSEPDPVPDRVGLFIFMACAPFAFLVVRALIRAGWSVYRGSGEYGVATVGLIRPHIVFAPDLAKHMDDRVVWAALEHERAHVRHRDPLRIWIGQFVTDLQWPWGAAQSRFETWLVALECARDEEARGQGVEGPDLAAAIIASLRFHRGDKTRCVAQLIENRSALEERVARLLQPLPGVPQGSGPSAIRVTWLLTLAILLAIGLGALFGERFIGPLLALSS